MAIWCTIRTYAKHAAELGNETPGEAVFFVKPLNCLHEGGPLPVSQHPGEVHHEVECVIEIGPDLQPTKLAVGLDLTDRAAQGALRQEQLPWAKGKCFRSSAVIGPWAAWSGGWDALEFTATALQLTLTVNGELRQSASLSEMSLSPLQQMNALQQWAPVASGDVLFTGTPDGVGQLHQGDTLVARLSTASGEVLSELALTCD